MKIKFTKKALAVILSCVLVGTIGNNKCNFRVAIPEKTNVEKHLTFKRVKKWYFMSYYFSNDNTVKSEVKKINVKINNISYSFYTDNGVFSKKGLDFGTRTLLESIPNLEGDILDLGCGYGPIGIYLAKSGNVDMVDINKRSMGLAIKNSELNNVKVNVFESDGFKNITKKYDYIVTNPPIRVGKNKLYELLFEAKKHLKDNGIMYLVVNKDQGAKSILKDLNNKYEANVINKNKGFYIIEAKNSKKL